MESDGVRVERRGRKRKRKDVQNVVTDGEGKKRAVEMRSKALVGSYVKKEFEDIGIFFGKVVFYDRGFYRIDYEDGDCEDLKSGEVKRYIIGDDDFNDELLFKRKELDEFVLKKYAKEKDIKVGNAVELTNAIGGAEASSLSELSTCGTHENNGVQVGDGDSDSSSDSCEYACDGALSFEAEASLVPPPELPPSSGNLGVPDECVADLLSVYSFLRSFSIPLFLSPFGLEDFVGSLNCSVQNTLLDAIHVALMRALRRRFETLSLDGSDLASKFLRSMDWSLIDALTWPVFLVQYLMMMGYTDKHEWGGFYIDALQRDYYHLSVGRKLVILQILCDDALDSAELRAEIDMREESEVGINSDGVTVAAFECGPRRVHPRYSKTSACKDQEAMDIITDRYETKSFRNSISLGYKSTGTDAGADDQDGNGDECRLCGMDGTLLCCDGCPSVYHSRCIGVSKMFIPEGEWYCPECTINKIGPTITIGTSLRGAELFGVDPYEQVFLGTCNHLLVIKMSISSEPCIRYYYQKDIPKVLRALHSTVQHVTMYSGLCKGIIQYWKIPVDITSLTEKVEMGTKLASEKEDSGFPTPSLAPLSKNSHDFLELAESEKFASCVAESSSENVAISCLGNICDEPGINNASLDTLTQPDHPGHQQGNSDCTTEQAWPLWNSNFSEKIKLEATMSSGSVSQQTDPTDLIQQELAGKSELRGYASYTSGKSNSSNRVHVNGTCVVASISSQGKLANCPVSGRDYRNVADGCIYMGSSFKAQAYINNYTNGDFAASAAANLAILSSDENRASESHALDNYRKVMSANVSLQVKAFSSAVSCFFWPNSEKKLVEVPRERCGWCLSCKAPVQSKKACLLNATASNAIKGTMKILAGICPVKNREGNLYGIATYLMFMEESLRGLTAGSFQSPTYRKRWCKQAEQALTCSEIKSLLLELEENIRVVAFTGDWVKLVDGWSVESSVTQSTTAAVGSSQKRGPGGRRGRKQSVMPEVTGDDGRDISNGFIWWRGGILSKLIFQKGILPLTILKKSARQGGFRKIPSIYYAEGVQVPKRSRQFVWRAAVELSKNTSQLAAQIRYLDIHVRWGDLVRPEQSPLDGKGAETEASAFRNAFICNKQNTDNKIRYAVAFGGQKHLPSRVMKNVIEVEKSEDGKEKYWFPETRVPLYMIKEYEEKVEKVPLPPAEKPVNVLSKLQRRQLKASRKDIFSYLSRRRDNLDMCRCASCQIDVFLGNAVKCRICEGYCHVQCTVSSTLHMHEKFEFLITCKRCHQTEAIMQNENYNVTPTSPLLLQRQEPQNSLTVFKGGKQNGYNMPLASNGALDSSSDRKAISNGSSLKLKNRSKLQSWGLIWKKNCEDTGIDFRLKHILLKGNQNVLKVECNLCKKPYNSDLMYISCETCKKWYHADAVELEESRIFALLGFKCCKCRRIRSPTCPYADQINKVVLEGKNLRKRPPKQGSLLVDPSPETFYEQLIEREPATLVLPVKEELVRIEGDDPSMFSLLRVEHATEQTSEVELEWNSASFSKLGPQKLPFRRHMKQENDIVCSSVNNPPGDSSTPLIGNSLLPADESSSHCVEWNVSTNSSEDGMMVDYDGPNYEDMEFEPQTYFSFTELLESDDGGGQLDGVDPSGAIIEDLDNLSIILRDGNPETHGIGINRQKHTDSLQQAVHVVPCRICSRTEPSPDRSCEICGLWMHSDCSPLAEESSGQVGWRCCNCREWR